MSERSNNRLPSNFRRKGDPQTGNSTHSSDSKRSQNRNSNPFEKFEIKKGSSK